MEGMKWIEGQASSSWLKWTAVEYRSKHNRNIHSASAAAMQYIHSLQELADSSQPQTKCLLNNNNNNKVKGKAASMRTDSMMYAKMMWGVVVALSKLDGKAAAHAANYIHTKAAATASE